MAATTARTTLKVLEPEASRHSDATRISKMMPIIDYSVFKLINYSTMTVE